MMQFQARLLQRVKEQKERIEELERKDQEQRAQLEEQGQSLRKMTTSYLRSKEDPNPKAGGVVQIRSPLEFLFFVYGPSNCRPFESINAISTEQQAELIRSFLSSVTTLNAVDVVKPLIAAGMKELSSYHRASSMYCILFNFVKDNELFHSDHSVNMLTQWNEFHISRSLFLPMEQFMILFAAQREVQSPSLFVFVYELSLWIIENRYDFKRFRSDWHRFNGHPELDGDGDRDSDHGRDCDDDDDSGSSPRSDGSSSDEGTAGRSKTTKSAQITVENVGDEVDEDRFAKYVVSLVYPKRFGQGSAEQIDGGWIQFLNKWTPNSVLKRMEQFERGDRGVSYQYNVQQKR